MKIKEVIEFYETKERMAAELGISIETVRGWTKADKIPRLTQLAIQTLTKNKLKAD